MKSLTKKDRPTLSLKKKLLFNLIMFLIPLIVFLLLELSLRFFSYGYELSLFKKSNNYPGYYELNKDVSKRFFSKSNGTVPTNDIFLIKKPDTSLIYTGHNEYYGALGVGSVESIGNARWIKRLHLSLIKFRTYQLVQRIIESIRKLSDPGEPKFGTLMARIVKNKSIEYRSDSYNAGIEQFRSNMDEVVKKIKNAGIPLIFSDVVSNTKMAPFKSIKSEDYQRADSVFFRACELEKEGKFYEAREAYYLAKDIDVIRFRAPEDLNYAIYDICSKYKVPVLGMKKIFEQHSPKGIIGYNLILEHLHPNVDGYFLMADAFFNEMRKNNFISQTWDTSKIKPSS